MRNISKRTFPILLAFMLVLQSFAINTISAADGLTDIEGHWAQSHIQSMVDAGGINGYPDNTFKPDNAITRAEFITVISGLLDLEDQETIAFADSLIHWANGAIGGAMTYGLLDGEDYYNPSTYSYDFQPDTNITRGEMARIIVRALGTEYTALTYGGSLDAFSDGGAIEKSLMGYISVASDNGIINGYPDGTFGSDKTATRAEACVMLNRMLGVMNQDTVQTLADSEAIYRDYSQNMVEIFNYDSTGQLWGTGSGFVIDDTGKIATNYHVIDGATTLEVEFIDGTLLPVTEVINYSVGKDVAVLQIEGMPADVQPVVLGNDRKAGIGSKVYAMGYPKGEDLSITDGLISSKYLNIDGEYYLQTSAPISSGNSGGPLINKYGEVIGINTLSRYDAQNMNYAIPVSFIAELLTEDHSMTMGAFASRNTDVMDKHNVYIIASYLYGVDKVTGEKIYTDGNHFTSDQISGFGQEIILSHDPVDGDDASYIELDLYDGDYDYYDYDIQMITLSETGSTYCDILFESYYGVLPESGKYYTETYLGEYYSIDDEFSYDDFSGLADYHNTYESIDFFKPEYYYDSGQIIVDDSFDSSELDYLMGTHEITFEETFDYYKSFLVTYELTGPDGSVDTFYDTVFGQPGTNTGYNMFFYGYGYAGFLTAGDYSLTAYIGGEKMGSSDFSITGTASGIEDLEFEKIEFDDADGNRSDTISFDGVQTPVLTLSYSSVPSDTWLDVNYVIRWSSESPDQVYSLTNANTFQVYEDDDSSDHPVMLADAYIPGRMFDDRREGDDIVMDLYLENQLVETIVLRENIEFEDDLAIAGLFLTATGISRDDMFMSDNYTVLLDQFEANTEDTLSLTDLEGGSLAYRILVDEPGNGSDLTMTEDLRVVIEDASGSVVGERAEYGLLWLSYMDINYMDNFEMIDGFQWAVGTYTIKVLHGEGESVSYEMTLTVTE